MEKIYEGDSGKINSDIFSDNLFRDYYGLISALFIYKGGNEFAKNDFLFSGNGNILKIYQNSNLVFSLPIFESNKITKIKSFTGGSEREYIFFLGETECKYTVFNKNKTFEENLQPFHLYSHNQNKEVDYILNINFIQIKNNFFLIVGYIGNFIEINLISELNNSFNDQTLTKRIYCPEKCIVYAMNILYDKDCNKLLIASGTVFRNIVVWEVSLEGDYQIINRIDLKGHEGVVFNLHFADKHNLVSVSDDRTTKHWKIEYTKNDGIEYCKGYTHESYIGHTARVWDARVNLEKDILVSVSEDSTVRVYRLKTKALIRELSGVHIGKNVRCVEMDQNYIYSAGEDWQIVKWNINKILLSSEKNNLDLTKVDSDFHMTFSLSTEDDQFKLAQSKQKNFSPAVKILKFLNPDVLLIGTNHGQVLKLKIDSTKTEIIYSDINCRVINSLEFINLPQRQVLLIGLSDGHISMIDRLNSKTDNINFQEVKVFHNLRIPFICHKSLNDNSLFIIISNPLGLSKIFYFEDKDSFNLEGNPYYLEIFTGVKSSSPIASCEIVPILRNNEKSYHYKEFLIFLGDIEGNLFFTSLRIISSKVYCFSDLRYLKPHSDKITMISYSKDDESIYTCARDGKFKRFYIHQEVIERINQDYYTIVEIDCKYRNDITSLESFYFDEGNKRYFAGHFGRKFVLYNFNKNLIFHSNDVKGVNRPFDINYVRTDNTSFSIIYAYSDAKVTKVIRVVEDKEVLLEKGNSLCSVYNTPLHGRLIHTVKFLQLSDHKLFINTPFALLATGSEDTNLNFYKFEFDSKERKNLVYLEQFTKHSGAIRRIEVIKKEVNYDKVNNIITFEFIIATVAACSECFLFKIQIIIEVLHTVDNSISLGNIKKHSLLFLSDLSVKVKNLDTRNMGIHSVNLEATGNFKGDRYLIIYCNTLANVESFLFDFSKNQFKPQNRSEFKLADTNFIPLVVNSVQLPNKSSQCMKSMKSMDLLLLFGLTNGVIYTVEKTIDLDGMQLISQCEKLDYKQYKIHEAGINDIQVYQSEEKVVVFSCGEDNSIVMSTLNETNLLQLLRKIKSLHSSPIKSISLWNANLIITLLTSGYDQKANILHFDLSDISSSEYQYNPKSIKTCVSEINCVDVLRFLNTFFFASVGQGLEIIQINN